MEEKINEPSAQWHARRAREEREGGRERNALAYEAFGRAEALLCLVEWAENYAANPDDIPELVKARSALYFRSDDAEPVIGLDAVRKIELWFFRDLNDAHRLKLFSLFGLPTAGLVTLGSQKIAFRSVMKANHTKMSVTVEKAGAR